MSKKQFKSFVRIGSGITGLALLFVVIAAVVIIASNLRLRFDMTGDKLYSLSHGSRKVLGQLEDELTLKFFFSESSPEMPMGMKTYARQVQDLLKEYEIEGKGRVRLEFHDPKPDSDAEEWAHRYGIAPQRATPFGSPIYFGLVGVGGKVEGVIPSFMPRNESTLEYDITRLVTQVAWPEKPVLGVMSTLPVLGTPPNPMMRTRPRDMGWAAFRELRDNYTLRKVEADAVEIEGDVKTLIVVHPKNFSDETLFAIDQFVLRGGRLVVLADPFCFSDFIFNMAQNQMTAPPVSPPGPSTLGPLFDAWGVSFDVGKVVADISASTALNTADGRTEHNPAVLSLDAKSMAKDDLLTAQLTQVLFPFSGEIVDMEAEGVTLTPLITSSEDNSCLVDAMSLQMGADGLRGQLVPDGKGRVLAARLQGVFKTAFPDGLPGADTNAVPPALASGSGTVVIFGDADFIYDDFSVRIVDTFFGPVRQPLNENLSLFANVVEQLAGREELIGVRSRGAFQRPFTKVDDLETKALKRWQAEEERLEEALMETQRRLEALEQGKTGSERLILSPEQQAELDQFREKQVKTRRQLKDVRKNLTRDIENLGLRIKTINILLVPMCVAAFGIVRGLVKRRH